MLKTNLCGIPLKNPLIMASGTFGFGKEFLPYMDVSKLGAVVSKTVTIQPKAGNYGPRVWETPSGILNSVGLQNPGVKIFIEEELPRMKQHLGTTIISSLGGNTMEDYVEGARLLGQTDVAMIELNISCPNVKEGGMAFGMEPSTAASVITEIKKVTDKPLMVKLSPNAPHLVDVACACEQAGADALSLINTIQGMVIDLHTRKPVFRNTFAGLSGPAVMPIALRMVYQVCQKVSIPVVGLGGIMSGEDAAQFIMAGATAVQIGTANFTDPASALRIADELEEFCKNNHISSLDEIRGVAL